MKPVQHLDPPADGPDPLPRNRSIAGVNPADKSRPGPFQQLILNGQSRPDPATEKKKKNKRKDKKKDKLKAQSSTKLPVLEDQGLPTNALGTRGTDVLLPPVRRVSFVQAKKIITEAREPLASVGEAEMFLLALLSGSRGGPWASS
jgi:hypothetical protein